MEIRNKKAYYDYFVESTLEAGLALEGTEVKSIRNGSANLKDSYCIFKNNEVFILNMHIAKYSEGNIFNHDEDRTRKLLLHKREIKKLKEYKEKSGFSIIPLKIYFKKGYAKVLVGICKGKKNYDKRAVLKKKTEERERRNYM